MGYYIMYLFETGYYCLPSEHERNILLHPRARNYAIICVRSIIISSTELSICMHANTLGDGEQRQRADYIAEAADSRSDEAREHRAAGQPLPASLTRMMMPLTS